LGWFSKIFSGGPKVLPEHVSDLGSFKERVLESPLPVILDVWSETCAPCRMLEPIIVELATKYQGRIRLAELNSTAADPELIEKLDIRATPTILVYENGAEVGRTAGFKPRAWFEEMIATEFPPET
jgi:thioredoxin 1